MAYIQQSPDVTLDAIEELIERGILSAEKMPEPNYWHWDVEKPDQLPQWLQDNYKTYNEIRHYWN